MHPAQGHRVWTFTNCLGYLTMSSLGEGKGNKIEPVSQGVYSSVGVIEK